MHKTKLVLLTAAALLAITSGAEAAKVKRSSGFSMGRPASVKPVQKPAPVTNPVPVSYTHLTLPTRAIV